MDFLRRTPRRIRGLKPQIIVLLDLENLIFKAGLPPPGRSPIVAFENLIQELKKIGEIALGLVFTPRHLLTTYAEFFQEQGFFLVTCPKMGDEDTVDQNLIALGEQLIEEMPGLTHLCLGSGDDDFIPLLEKARHKELPIIIAAGDSVSLSWRISRMAWVDPKTNKKAIFILSHTNG